MISARDASGKCSTRGKSCCVGDGPCFLRVSKSAPAQYTLSNMSGCKLLYFGFTVRILFDLSMVIIGLNRDTLQPLVDESTGECQLILQERCKDITFVASLQGSVFLHISRIKDSMLN